MAKRMTLILYAMLPFKNCFILGFFFSRIWGVLKGLENLHIWILLNFVIEFIGGALWMTKEVSF